MTDAAAVAWCQHETPVSSRGTVAAEGLGVNTMCCYGRPSLLAPPKQLIRGTWVEGGVIRHRLGSDPGCVGSVEWGVIRKEGKKEELHPSKEQNVGPLWHSSLAVPCDKCTKQKGAKRTFN